MENKTFYNEVLIEHNQHPIHKEKLPDANLVLEGVNPSCGDDIILQLKVENDASADIMLDMIIGRGKEEALHLAELFLKMIQGKTTADEMDELEEAGVLADIAHMPARVKCAVLGWHTMEEMLGKKE